MSAARWYPRPLVVIATIFAALVTSSCRVGQNPSLSPSATNPHGIFVTADWDARVAPRYPPGELIGADDQGVYLLHPDALALYQFGAPVVLHPDDDPPEALDLRVEDEVLVESFMHYARHPFGVNERILRSVLDASGMDSVVTRRRP